MAAGEKKSAAKSGDLVVSAPLVSVRTKGGADRHHYFGDILGDDVTKESVDHLKDLGFVSESE